MKKPWPAAAASERKARARSAAKATCHLQIAGKSTQLQGRPSSESRALFTSLVSRLYCIFVLKWERLVCERQGGRRWSFRSHVNDKRAFFFSSSMYGRREGEGVATGRRRGRHLPIRNTSARSRRKAEEAMSKIMPAAPSVASRLWSVGWCALQRPFLEAPPRCVFCTCRREFSRADGLRMLNVQSDHIYIYMPMSPKCSQSAVKSAESGDILWRVTAIGFRFAWAQLHLKQNDREFGLQKTNFNWND